MRIEGHTLAELDALTDDFVIRVEDALLRVTTKVALNLARNSHGRTGIVAAGELEAGEDVIILWNEEVPELAAYVDGVYESGALEAAAELAASLPLDPGQGIPGVPDHFALDYLSQATNRLQGIGDDLWENVRNELVEGLSLGESITELAARVQKSAGVTAPRARTIARTELVAASNAGTHTQVMMIVPEAHKTWVATNDGRVRHSHHLADGQTVPVAEAFTVGASTVRWPGDPGGAPGEIINCRCTLVYEVKDDSIPAVTCDCGTPAITAATIYTGTCTCAVTLPHPADPAQSTFLDPGTHAQIFDMFMEDGAISPAYGGAKIHKKLQELRAKLPTHFEQNVTDEQLLDIIDEVYLSLGKKSTFSQKYDEWLQSPAGKKATQVGVPVAQKITPSAVPPAPKFTPGPAVTTAPKPPPLAPTLPPIKPKPDPASLTYTGKTLGSHGAQVWVDDSGGRWLFKPQQKFMTLIDTAMARLQSKALATRTATYEITLNGKHGSIQYMFDGSKNAWPNDKMDPAKLTPEEVVVLQREHIFDWLIGNHDAHEGQFVRLPDGTVVGVDKGQAFKFLGTDKLDWEYFAPGNFGTPVYNTLWKAFVEGKIDLQDPTTGEVGEFLARLTAISDDDYRELLRPYVEALPFTPKGGSVEAFLDMAVARKNSLKYDFSELWARALKQRQKNGFSVPAPVKPAKSVRKTASIPESEQALPPPTPTPTPTSFPANYPIGEVNPLETDEVLKLANYSFVGDGDVIAEAFTSNGVPMRVLKVLASNADGTHTVGVKTQYFESGKWHTNETFITTVDELELNHPGVQWHFDGLFGEDLEVVAQSPTQSVVTIVTTPADVADITTTQKYTLLALMKDPQPITPGWGGAKVYKQLQALKLKVQTVDISGLTDAQLLGLLDDVAGHKTSKTYLSVVKDWLATPAGKKYANGGPEVLDVSPVITPKAPKVAQTPVADVVTPPATPGESVVADTTKLILTGDLDHATPSDYDEGTLVAISQSGQARIIVMNGKFVKQEWEDGHWYPESSSSNFHDLGLAWDDPISPQWYAPKVVKTSQSTSADTSPSMVGEPYDSQTFDAVTSETATHYDGKIVAVSADYDQRIIWTQGVYVLQRLNLLGDWFNVSNESSGSIFPVPSGGWYVPGVDATDVTKAAQAVKSQSTKATKKTQKAAKKTAKKATKKATKNAAQDLVDAISESQITLTSAQVTKVFKAFKSKVPGSYLSNSPELIFDHLYDVQQKLKTDNPATYKDLTLLDILRIIDAESAKKVNASNTNLFEKKITHWLGTGQGKTHAEQVVSGAKQTTSKTSATKKTTTTTSPTSPTPQSPTNYYKGTAQVKVAKYPKPPVPDLAPTVKTASPTSTRAFDSMHHAEVIEMRDEMFAQQGDWSAAQRASLRYYTSNAGYAAMNNCARGYVNCSPTALKHLKDAQAGMRRATRNLVLRRGTNADEFPGFPRDAPTSMLESLVGRTLRMDSFLSTSYGDRPAFGGNVMIEYEVPAGTPLAYVQHISHYPGENELLLGMGTEIEVLSVTEQSRGWGGPVRVVRVRIIPQS